MTRPAAEIGRGLEAARPARPIRRGERIHVLGAAGAGASAAVLLAHRAGAAVSGCDPGGPSPYTAAAAAAGIPLAWEHSPSHVAVAPDERPERLGVTKALTAVAPDHPELVAARTLGIRLEAWQQLIADVATTTGQKLIAVAGTHGKSTTAGWLVELLVGAGRDPSAFVGALLDPALTGGVPSTARWGEGEAFVVEADEYAGNFDPYRPALIILLNAEWDHPDIFADEDAVVAAFEAWIRRAAGATLVANVGDAGARRVVERLANWNGRIVSVSIGGTADVSATIRQSERDTTLSVSRAGRPPASFRIGLPGPANAANALALIAVAGELGIGDDALSRGLSEFGGVGRRLEVKGEVNGVLVLDDYAHHPTAIARTLEAVRQRYPDRPIWAVYEPLTYHRTALMLGSFADVLSSADAVAIADIWPGRDPDTTVTSAAALVAEVNRRGRAPAAYSGSVEQTALHLAERVRPGDVVLVMGGGRSYAIADRLVELLTSKA